MRVQNSQAKYSGFSIIEVLIGIFIFSLGLISIYAILVSSLSVNERNKNSIIASNLAREQIELLRNIRDTNYKKPQVWNQIDPTTSGGDQFAAGNYYTLENNFGAGVTPVVMTELASHVEGETQLSGMQDYRLYLNADNMYTYDDSSGNTETIFYRYLYISDTELNDDGTDGAALPAGAFRVISKVIWYKRGYYEIDIQTIITDWGRI
ncbi:prepilin-type N-terminal cleavage/methylation domain-containing protein [Candidatus Gracilibacteria bacterium]|nr:prepilin-type N-terminal cleavage/methylation domain-containing protein [Candidatus Gracilibacteria bacterium]